MKEVAMKLLLLVILTIVFTSCAGTKTRRPYEYNNLKVKVTTNYDAATGNAYIDQGYEDGILKYQELVTKGQINNNEDSSCLNDPKSINYV
jgi:hypothetical protein